MVDARKKWKRRIVLELERKDLAEVCEAIIDAANEVVHVLNYNAIAKLREEVEILRRAVEEMKAPR